MPTIPRDQSNSWFYSGISYFILELDWISKPHLILCFFTAPVLVSFCLYMCSFPVLDYFLQRTHNNPLESLFQEMQRQPLQHCHAISPFPIQVTRQNRRGLWKIRTPPSLSHIREKLPCAFWHLPIVELSALGTALADKGKCSLWWGCAVDFSLHRERSCQTVEGQAQSVLPLSHCPLVSVLNSPL